MRGGNWNTVFIGFLITLLLACAASAVTKQPKVEKRYYFGINLPYNTIGGDFDKSSSVIVGDTSGSVLEKIMTPELKNGFGFGISAGYTRIGMNHFGYSIEFSYHLGSHDYLWGIRTGDASFHVVNVDFKTIYSIFPIEPYLYLGIAVPRIKINDGGGMRNDGTYFNRVDATYKGIGVNFGAGLEIFITRGISLSGTAGYRWINYSSVSANAGKVDIAGGISGSGLHISGTLKYNIPAN